MTTRHVSNQVTYPFVTPILTDEIKGILDIYLVIMGVPDSIAGVFETDIRVELVEVDDQGATTKYTLMAYKGYGVWDFEFIVPHTGDTGQVQNSVGNDCVGTFIYNANNVYQGGGTITNVYELEPSRAQFHTEQVNSIIFQNVCRTAGVEDFTELVNVIEFTDMSPFTDSVVIPFEDGYNTIIRYDEETDTLSITAEQGIGKGQSPDYGDVAGCGESGSSSGSSSGVSGSSSTCDRDSAFVRILNGLVPVNGDIPINVSQSLSLNIAKGRVEILAR
jgi:hypothetical protein